MNPNDLVGDHNTKRLLEVAGAPEPVPAEFAAKVEKTLLEAAQALRQTTRTPEPPNRYRAYALIASGLAACLFVGTFIALRTPPRQLPKGDAFAKARLARWTDDVGDSMLPRKRPDAPALAVLKDGESLTTKASERRLVQLGDGTRVFVNEKSHVAASGPRQVTLHNGEIYLEVAPLDAGPRFTVKSGSREITATGTHFAVQADAKAPGVIVTQGKVNVGRLEVTAGQRVEPGKNAVTAAARASHALAWTRDLMAAAETPMVPSCQHAGGALVAIDPQGQEIKLSLRKYHIDVHIEDGFARTTIDQTYFNTTWERLEGTFYFPLPPDASLSRLAMYVADGNECKLMEGGMAERKHAADVYETIRYQRRDPALLEWLDGSTFKMRVFPLEAKQEKRIILSYTQKLPALYGITRYRFPGGLNMPLVREWSFNARIKNGSAMNLWSPSHASMNRIVDQGVDVVASFVDENVKPEVDIVLEMQDREAQVQREAARFSSMVHEGQTYLMLRYRPTLPSLPVRQRRDWIVLFEASAHRDPLLAGTQIDVLRQLLKNAEYDDTFVMLTANSQVRTYPGEPCRVSGRVADAKSPDSLRSPARPQIVAEAVKFLQQTHLVGALDLQQGLEAAIKHAKDAKNPHILHIGSGTPALGERDANKLAALLPESVRYVGVGVGKRWNRAFMKAAAERTGGTFTQINPDEVIAWRAFDLLATLNTPRLLDVHVVDANEKARFLTETTMLAQGEELCAMTRVDFKNIAMPSKVLIRGTLDGKTFTKEFPVINVQDGAGYLPRMWAKQEIDRLLADGSAKNKDEITNLSKAMYVMSPFTSLLVLETDADYVRFNVDKGRKDHWAMYPAPAKIPLVHEPNVPVKVDVKMPGRKPTVAEVLRTIVPPPRVYGVDVVNVTPVLETELDFNFMRDRTSEVKILLRQGIGSYKQSKWKDSEQIARKVLAIDRENVPALQLLMQSQTRFNDKSPQQNQDIFLSQLDTTLGPVPAPELARLQSGEWRKDGGKGVGMFNKQKLVDSWGRLPANEQETLHAEMRGVSPRHRAALEAYISKLKGADPGAPLGGQKDVKFKTILRDLDTRISVQRLSNELMELEQIQSKVTKRTVDLTNKAKKMYLGDEFSVLDRHGGYISPEELAGFNIEAAHHYERPQVNYDNTLFTNLVQYAPGLHTAYADVLATLDAEADVEPVKLGAVDSAARKLIDKARSSAWTVVTIPAEGALPSWKIYFNGRGQFTYDRRLASGLREQVICDGATLWHLYPEIGLGARRPFSRHHHGLLAGFAPAFLPDADELARGCHVRAIDANTVAIDPGAEAKARIHLVFAKDGRLSERRVVEMPGGKTLLTQVIGANGVIEWKNAEGKVLASQTLAVAPAKAPNLKPAISELVVMQMPIRTSSHHQAADVLDLEQAVISECVANTGNDGLLRIAGQKYQRDGDRRIGFATLLAARGFQHVEKDGWVIDPAIPLACFLAHSQRDAIANTQQPLDNLAGPKDGFIQRLNQFRSIWCAWNAGRAIANNGAGLPIEKAKVLNFLKETTSPTFAYAILDAMQRRSNIAPSDEMLGVAVERFGLNCDPLGLGYYLRYEHARSLGQPGKGQEAGKRFRELYADTLKHGVLPPVDASFRNALQMADGDGPKFVPFIRQTLAGLLAEKQFGLAIQLARQVGQLGDNLLADECLNSILSAKATREEMQVVRIGAAKYLTYRQSFARADRLVQTVLEETSLTLQAQNQAALWRWRAELTQGAGETAVSIACLEKALELEYAEFPEIVNLDSIRADYRTLLGHYVKLAEAMALLEGAQLAGQQAASAKPQAALIAKVIRAADRWRLIEPEATEPCQLAGAILQKLGQRELAWDYWTTPIDLYPAESKAWSDLAELLKGVGELEQADRAYAIAFETEPSNPEILWNRGQNLARMGQPARARQFYAQIADGQWQERFGGIVQQARQFARQ